MRRTTTRLVLAAVLLVVCMVGSLAGAAPAETASDCAQPSPQAFTGKKVAVNLPEGSALNHKIGRERSGEISDELTIKTVEEAALPSAGTSLRGESVGSMKALPGEGSGRIHASQISVGVTTSGGNTLIVDSCINPHGLEPGRYAGKVLIHGGEIQQFVIPLTATVKSNRAGLWLLLALGAGALGFALRTIANLAQAAERPVGEDGRRPRDRTLRSVWPLYRRNYLIFGASIMLAIIAVVVAWYGTYWTNDTFGAGDLADVGKLIGAALVAATGGTTLADVGAALYFKKPGD